MKKLISTTVLVILAMVSYAQEEKEVKYPEPEYTGNIVYINEDLGKTVPLEKQKASGKAKAGAGALLVGIGKVKGFNLVDGVKSPVRINQNIDLQFIVKSRDNSSDPFSFINIFKLSKNEKKEYRYIEVNSRSTFGGNKANDIEYLPFKAVKYGESSYLITLENVVQPGEYAITLDGSREVFNLFGVDN